MQKVDMLSYHNTAFMKANFVIALMLHKNMVITRGISTDVSVSVCILLVSHKQIQHN